MVAQTRFRPVRTLLSDRNSGTLVVAVNLPCPRVQALEAAFAGRNAMEILKTMVSIFAGMSFSLAIALLVEELIFAKVFCPLFARQAVRIKSQQKR